MYPANPVNTVVRTLTDLNEALRRVGADSEDGKFRLRCSQPLGFLGHKDQVLVTTNDVFFKSGIEYSLWSLLQTVPESVPVLHQFGEDH